MILWIWHTVKKIPYFKNICICKCLKTTVKLLMLNSVLYKVHVHMSLGALGEHGFREMSMEMEMAAHPDPMHWLSKQDIIVS